MGRAYLMAHLEKLDNTLQDKYDTRLEYFDDLTELISWLGDKHPEESRALVEWIESAQLNGAI